MIWRITEQQVLASAGLDAYVVGSIADHTSIAFPDQLPVPTLLQARLQVLIRHPLLLTRGIQASPRRKPGANTQERNASCTESFRPTTSSGEQLVPIRSEGEADL